MFTISRSYEWFGFPTPCKFFVVAVKHGTLPLFVVLRALPLLAYRFPLLHLPRLQSLLLLLRVPRGFVRQVRQLQELLVFY